MESFLVFITGDITQKGYEKKRARLLQPYISKQIGEVLSLSLSHTHTHTYSFLEFIKNARKRKISFTSSIRSNKANEQISEYLSFCNISDP